MATTDIKKLIDLARVQSKKFGGAPDSEDIASEAVLKVVPLLRRDGRLEDLHDLEKAVTNARKRFQRSTERTRRRINVDPSELPPRLQSYDDPRLEEVVERDHWRGVQVKAAGLIGEILNREPECGKPFLSQLQRIILAEDFGLDDTLDADDLKKIPTRKEARRKASYRARLALQRILDEEIEARLADPDDNDRALWRDLYLVVHGVSSRRP